MTTPIKNDADMLAAAIQGFKRQVEKPALWSSAIWFAQRTGEEMRAAGLTAPTKCAMSRGYAVRVKTDAGNAYRLQFAGEGFKRCKILAEG